MTRKERLTRIFENQEIDRPAIKLWGAGTGTDLLHPAYGPILRRAQEITELFGSAMSDFHMVCGQNCGRDITRTVVPTASPLWRDRIVTYHTPRGDLTGRYRESTVGEPGYCVEYPIKEPEDLENLLEMPYEAYPVSSRTWREEEKKLGDRGIVVYGLDHAGYALQRMMGSETLAYFSVDCRELVLRALRCFGDRIHEHVEAVMAKGFRGVFGWVGPEVLIPPLLGPNDFEEFVFDIDKPVCDAIHNGGGRCWLHCHGKVAGFLDRFIEMGIDVLNPLEPPKNGDISLERDIAEFGNRIGWEGNIEIQDILQDPPELLKEKLHACVTAGWASGRFILCSSAGFMEFPSPAPSFIENLHLYLEEGYRAVEACRR